MSVIQADYPKVDQPPSVRPAPRRAALFLGGMIALALLFLNMRSLLFPMLAYDDFPIISESNTWRNTVDNLWVPHNENAMAVGRLFAFVVVQVVPVTALPLIGVLVGYFSVLLGVFLLYSFVRRELGHPFYGFMAAVLFAVSTSYGSCVYWFACSFWMMGLDTILLALLAAQGWRQSGRGFYLDLCILACVLAPGWNALSILAGPLCCLYLLPPRNRNESPVAVYGDRVEGENGALLERFNRFTLTPLLGPLLFLAYSLPRTAATIMNLPHYQGKTALEAFDPENGLIRTGRIIVDNLLIGLLGFFVDKDPLPAEVAFSVLAVVALVTCWWLWQSPQPRIVLVGLAFIVCSYWLILSGRASWEYNFATDHGQSRYNVLPQLGLALVMSGGLKGHASRWFRLSASGRLTRGQFRALFALIALFFAVQLPRGIRCGFEYKPEQAQTLRRVQAMDARLREHHIAARAAVDVLPPLGVAGYPEFNAWNMLRGSDDPKPLQRDEIQHLLEGVDY